MEIDLSIMTALPGQLIPRICPSDCKEHKWHFRMGGGRFAYSTYARIETITDEAVTLSSWTLCKKIVAKTMTCYIGQRIWQIYRGHELKVRLSTKTYMIERPHWDALSERFKQIMDNLPLPFALQISVIKYLNNDFLFGDPIASIEEDPTS